MKKTEFFISCIFLLFILICKINSQICFGLTNPAACNGAAGTCIGLDSCSCVAGWTDPDCSVPICYGLIEPLACNGPLGTCLGPDTCSCTAGWGGVDCTSPICYGLTDPAACTGSQGTCTAPDTCTCAVGHSGPECQETICYGLIDPAACSGIFGTCVAPDTCNCVPGYSGLDCAFFSCNGVPSVSGLTCNMHGTCVSSDNCVCDPGWTGGFCQFPICYGIPSSTGIACGGILQGNCTAPDNCVCESGWTDPDCGTPSCFGLMDPAACSGSQGVCLGGNICQCSPGFIGSNCSLPLPPPPSACIIDNTILSSNPDFEYIYWHNLTHAIGGCRAAPIQHIYVTTGQTIFDPPVTITRLNSDQNELLLEPLGVGATPIMVGFNHTLTTTYNKINITGLHFVSLDFPGGVLSTPGINYAHIFGGQTNELIFNNVILQSLPFPASAPSITNEPNIERLIDVKSSGGFQFIMSELLGSRKGGLVVGDGLSSNATSGSEIIITDTNGQHNWGNFIKLTGVQRLTMFNNLCNTLCGGIAEDGDAVINIDYKGILNAPGTFYLNAINNQVIVSNALLQSTVGNPLTTGGFLSAFRIAGLNNVYDVALGIELFNFKNNIGSGLPGGIRFQSVSKDILKLNYIGELIVLDDSRQELRQNALVNSNFNPLIGNFQGSEFDVRSGSAVTDPVASSTNTCNDYCLPDLLCCEVNSNFNATTPGFGSIRFQTVQDAIVHRPGGCNFTFRCIKLTRTPGLEITTHFEDICWDDIEDVLFIGEVDPATNRRVRLTGLHTLARGISKKITFQTIRFQANATHHSQNIPIISPKPGIPPVMYELTFEDNWVTTEGLDSSTNHQAEFIFIPELEFGKFTINTTRIKSGFNNPGGSIIKIQYVTTTNSSSCADVEIRDLIIDKAADNALWIKNPKQIKMIGNTINECGSHLPQPISFACVYIKHCYELHPLLPQIIQDNTLTGPLTPFYDTDDLSATFVTYTEKPTATPNLHYTHLWLDTNINQTIVDNLNPLPIQIKEIHGNTISRNVLIRERINCWDLSGIPSTTALENQRTPIRTLNLQNNPQNLGVEASFYDTISGTNDVGIAATPKPLEYIYCTQGCQPVDFDKIHLYWIIGIVASVILCCVFLICFGGIRYYTDDDEWYLGQLNTERKRFKEVYNALKKKEN